MARKKSRQTFEKLKREQAVRERRARKEERKQASRIAKALGLPPAAEPDGDHDRDGRSAPENGEHNDPAGPGGDKQPERISAGEIAR
jgi:hypothetical protein